MPQRNRQKPSVFLDASIIIAGIYSATGGARALLKLGEFERVSLCLSADVLSEVERNIAKVSTALLSDVAVLLSAARVEICPSPDAQTARRLNQHIHYAPDAVVLAAAVEAHVDFFVTLDREHFLSNKSLPKALTVRIGTPGDCLAWLRTEIFQAE